jgi:chorismate mutase
MSTIWSNPTDELARAIAPIREELDERLTIILDDRDRLAVTVALVKAASTGFRRGAQLMTNNLQLEARAKGVTADIQVNIPEDTTPDLWELSAEG